MLPTLMEMFSAFVLTGVALAFPLGAIASVFRAIEAIGKRDYERYR
jgi:hypothetical protein